MSGSGDNGSGDSDSGESSGGPLRHGGPSGTDQLSLLCRAMRWETLVILLVLVVLAAVAS
ncbi:hypothetical protein QOM21_30840 [Streptomyces sp. Pv4-95]|uniref:hypothetical protein n=1 Tax=Streptomyces sp. Pv4-95 TaxID=3049543 RepID=UPI003891CC37